MKISRATLEILKNFAGINENLMIRPGNEIWTMTETKSIVGHAKIAETFDKEVRLLDLTLFNRVVGTLLSDPEIELHTNHMVLKEGRNSQVINYASESSMVFPRKGAPDLDWSLGFALTRADFEKINSALKTNNAKHVVFESDGDSAVKVKAEDVGDSSSNPFTIELEEASDQTFKVVFLGSNLNIMSRDYQVSVYFNPDNPDMKIARMQSEDLTYFLAVEKESTFG